MMSSKSRTNIKHFFVTNLSNEYKNDYMISLYYDCYDFNRETKIFFRETM